MDKRFIGALIAVVLVLGGIFIFSGGNKANNSSSTGSSGQPTNHIEGLGQDKVTLVEYGDYECPYCGGYYPIVKQVQQEYNTQIFFQFRNLPLTQLHPNAFAGARAAEAAALQGKFWQMHDLLYDNQDSAGQSGWVASKDPLNQYFVGLAQQIGLNVSQFKTDFASDKVNNLINADVAQFPKDFTAATGSYDPNKDEATPTFFLDGKQIQPQPTVAGFEKFINADIKKKGFTPPAAASTTTPSTTTTTGPTQSVQ